VGVFVLVGIGVFVGVGVAGAPAEQLTKNTNDKPSMRKRTFFNIYRFSGPPSGITLETKIFLNHNSLLNIRFLNSP
jgi:hypothetical protein